MSSTDILVSTDWLEGQLGRADLAIVDASWHMPASGREGRAEFDASHIPGAVHFDIETISDPSSDLAHTMPSAQTFEQAAGALGICETMEIVVYESEFPFSAPRVWLMFCLMGARRVHVLDGGLAKWRAENRPLTDTPSARPPASFHARFDAARVASFDEMTAIVRDRTAQVVDARSNPRFTGAEPEPRPGMRSGHMPGAVNMHYAGFARDDGTFKAPGELADMFAAAGIDTDRPVVASCGSGVTAAVPLLALALIGHETGRLYDGSWSEWGGRADTAIETGEACRGDR